ncbi:hypothetical protein ACJ72_05725 [Emergomyces africanus]|uniref:V-SNARE coiled-coil homology domain-containing protein n=1 Tax=Emergomyces africanus TaxID=1955775 RepID=A0A1B7NT36_9EURO|nr:hypothetical protein ACJ72_05725 [Emergomyces africanus]
MLRPVQATVENRLKDLDLDVLLLSDGEIWDQETLFSYIHNAVSEHPIRFFSLGIGSGASQSLIEGIARAGDGFAQFVHDNEQLDKKVVRMLKGALTPHIKDYTAEVVYEHGGEHEFEIIEKPNDIPPADNFCPPAKRSEETLEVDSPEDVSKSKEPISLFDPCYQESDISATVVPVETNLPKIQPPTVLQAPYRIPSLYPFNRTTVYFLLSPEAPSTTLKSLVLRGTSKHGPLSLNITLEDIGQGTKLHQLAARKLTLELEEGRGWVYHAKNQKGRLIIDEHESKKEDIVKREAVRLGIKFQVAGKYCSFVAVDSTSDQEKSNQKERPASIPSSPDSDSTEGEAYMDDMPESKQMCEFSGTPSHSNVHAMSNLSISDQDWFGPPAVSPYYSPLSSPSGFPPSPPPPGSASPFVSSFSAAPAINTASAFDSFPTNKMRRSDLGGPPASRGFGSPFTYSRSSHTTSTFGAPPKPASRILFGSAPLTSGQAQFHASTSQSATSAIDKVLERGERLDSLGHNTDHLSEQAVQFRSQSKRSVRSALLPSAARGFARFFNKADESPEPPEPLKDKLYALISLQSFEGSWQWDNNLFVVMELNGSEMERKVNWASILGKQTGVDIKNTNQRSIVATLLVLAYLNKNYLGEKEVWELVEEKAMAWAVEKIKEIGGNADRGPDKFLSLFDGLL